MNDYNGYFIQVLFRESVDFTAQYRYEHRSFHQCTILGLHLLK